MRGFLLYDGPSMIDGERIVCIATPPAQARLNVKTSRVVQTYILRADIDPIEAIDTGADQSICGACIHRGSGAGGRSCYVQVWSAPRNIWLAYQRGRYPPADAADIAACAGEVVRMGTYGDPAAAPFEVWERLFASGAAPLGYTHQWRTCDRRFALYCMASVESAAERAEASAAGYRTFRVRVSHETVLDGEIACPAAAESGKRTTCSECRACGGHAAKARCDVSIVVHGAPGLARAFARKTAPPRRRHGDRAVLIGQRHGRLVCLEADGAVAVLRCDCGQVVERRAADFARGRYQSCSAAECRVRSDLKGRRFGHLVVEKLGAGVAAARKRLWWCQCDCGAYLQIRGQSLVSGNTLSCGCRRRQASAERVAAAQRDNAGHFLPPVDLTPDAGNGLQYAIEAPERPGSAPDMQLEPLMSVFPPSNEEAKSYVAAREPEAKNQFSTPDEGFSASPIGPDDLSPFELAPVFLGTFEPPAGAGEACFDLGAAQCRWPIGDASSPSFRFCAAPADPAACPRYCADHRQGKREPTKWVPRRKVSATLMRLTS